LVKKVRNCLQYDEHPLFAKCVAHP